MLIAHLSDTHLSVPGALTCGVAPMAENLLACIGRINTLSPRPDLVLLTGDLTHAGSRAETEHAARLLARLDIPFHLVPGNHDNPALLRELFGASACAAAEADHCSHVIEGYPLRIIALDSTRPGHPGGALDAPRADWLTARLAEGGAAPTLLMQQHPPLKLGIPETDAAGFRGADALARILRAHPKVERILCGHVHMATHARWAGTVVTTAPSPGMQLVPDPAGRAASRFRLGGPEFLLHRWRPGRALVSLPCRVEPDHGPHPFC